MAHRTLMAVLAHPDDESTTLGGTLAFYASRGVRTILVTCTNGEYGDRPYGIKPGPGHDTQAVAAIRVEELRLACEHLLVSDLELLGYHDSGTVEWDYKNKAIAFCNMPLEEVASEITALLREYRPQVVLTHEPTSTRHPDHRHASQATTMAVEVTNIPMKFYYTAHGTTYWERIRRALARNGIARPKPGIERLQVTDRIDREITTSLDISSVLERKRAALYSHRSQIHNSTAAKVPAGEWSEVFRTEEHIRIYNSTGASTPEDDLFAGIA
ncbi:PIG-L deacetylase family protein [Nocardia arthritidis]